ncbi:hypothetical protein BESB_025580 [Besnoitia besnoiti]|uniref:PPM-type phosphatase domain-containing protein n=1 Tax=Besnoitia besnoiti TaxID=94643 RepID=A0A2A9M0T2_BESBE|nr:uncharacterized protein BESB_025580 [Besnoitia besnoiti]PFH31585.1 hypothetical protein BESB_025580 [Besnoitia besnoiti]
MSPTRHGPRRRGGTAKGAGASPRGPEPRSPSPASLSPSRAAAAPIGVPSCSPYAQNDAEERIGVGSVTPAEQARCLSPASEESLSISKQAVERSQSRDSGGQAPLQGGGVRASPETASRRGATSQAFSCAHRGLHGNADTAGPPGLTPQGSRESSESSPAGGAAVPLFAVRDGRGGGAPLGTARARLLLMRHGLAPLPPGASSPSAAPSGTANSLRFLRDLQTLPGPHGLHARHLASFLQKHRRTFAPAPCAASRAAVVRDGPGDPRRYPSGHPFVHPCGPGAASARGEDSGREPMLLAASSLVDFSSSVLFRNANSVNIGAAHAASGDSRESSHCHLLRLSSDLLPSVLTPSSSVFESAAGGLDRCKQRRSPSTVLLRESLFADRDSESLCARGAGLRSQGTTARDGESYCCSEFPSDPLHRRNWSVGDGNERGRLKETRDVVGSQYSASPQCFPAVAPLGKKLSAGSPSSSPAQAQVDKGAAVCGSRRHGRVSPSSSQTSSDAEGYRGDAAGDDGAPSMRLRTPKSLSVLTSPVATVLSAADDFLRSAVAVSVSSRQVWGEASAARDVGDGGAALKEGSGHEGFSEDAQLSSLAASPFSVAGERARDSEADGGAGGGWMEARSFGREQPTASGGPSPTGGLGSEVGNFVSGPGVRGALREQLQALEMTGMRAGMGRPGTLRAASQKEGEAEVVASNSCLQRRGRSLPPVRCADWRRSRAVVAALLGSNVASWRTKHLVQHLGRFPFFAGLRDMCREIYLRSSLGCARGAEDNSGSGFCVGRRREDESKGRWGRWVERGAENVHSGPSQAARGCAASGESSPASASFSTSFSRYPCARPKGRRGRVEWVRSAAADTQRTDPALGPSAACPCPNAASTATAAERRSLLASFTSCQSSSRQAVSSAFSSRSCEERDTEVGVPAASDSGECFRLNREAQGRGGIPGANGPLTSRSSANSRDGRCMWSPPEGWEESSASSDEFVEDEMDARQDFLGICSYRRRRRFSNPDSSHAQWRPAQSLLRRKLWRFTNIPSDATLVTGPHGEKGRNPGGRRAEVGSDAWHNGLGGSADAALSLFSPQMESGGGDGYGSFRGPDDDWTPSCTDSPRDRTRERRTVDFGFGASTAVVGGEVPGRRSSPSNPGGRSAMGEDSSSSAHRFGASPYRASSSCRSREEADVWKSEGGNGKGWAWRAQGMGADAHQEASREEDGAFGGGRGGGRADFTAPSSQGSVESVERERRAESSQKRFACHQVDSSCASLSRDPYLFARTPTGISMRPSAFSTWSSSSLNHSASSVDTPESGRREGEAEGRDGAGVYQRDGDRPREERMQAGVAGNRGHTAAPSSEAAPQALSTSSSDELAASSGVKTDLSYAIHSTVRGGGEVAGGTAGSGRSLQGSLFHGPWDLGKQCVSSPAGEDRFFHAAASRSSSRDNSPDPAGASAVPHIRVLSERGSDGESQPTEGRGGSASGRVEAGQEETCASYLPEATRTGSPAASHPYDGLAAEAARQGGVAPPRRSPVSLLQGSLPAAIGGRQSGASSSWPGSSSGVRSLPAAGAGASGLSHDSGNAAGLARPSGNGEGRGELAADEACGLSSNPVVRRGGATRSSASSIETEEGWVARQLEDFSQGGSDQETLESAASFCLRRKSGASWRNPPRLRACTLQRLLAKTHRRDLDAIEAFRRRTVSSESVGSAGSVESVSSLDNHSGGGGADSGVCLSRVFSHSASPSFTLGLVSSPVHGSPPTSPAPFPLDHGHGAQAEDSSAFYRGRIQRANTVAFGPEQGEGQVGVLTMHATRVSGCLRDFPQCVLEVILSGRGRRTRRRRREQEAGSLASRHADDDSEAEQIRGGRRQGTPVSDSSEGLGSLSRETSAPRWADSRRASAPTTLPSFSPAASAPCGAARPASGGSSSPVGRFTSGAGGKRPRLCLWLGSFSIPRDDKRYRGGEDAWFTSSMCNAFGVADGVGEWEDLAGINPQSFAEDLMRGSLKHIRSTKKKHWEKQAKAQQSGTAGDAQTDAEFDVAQVAAEALAKAHKEAKSYGSSTALVGVLNEDKGVFGFANLGDSSGMVLRRLRGNTRAAGTALSIVRRVKEMQHSFNVPYQFARLPAPEDWEHLRATGLHRLVAIAEKDFRDRAEQNMLAENSAADASENENESSIGDPPSCIQSTTVRVEDGDLILLGTDGLFDNLFDYEITALSSNLRQALRTPDLAGVVHGTFTCPRQVEQDSVSERADYESEGASWTHKGRKAKNEAAAEVEEASRILMPSDVIRVEKDQHGILTCADGFTYTVAPVVDMKDRDGEQFVSVKQGALSIVASVRHEGNDQSQLGAGKDQAGGPNTDGRVEETKDTGDSTSVSEAAVLVGLTGLPHQKTDGSHGVQPAVSIGKPVVLLCMGRGARVVALPPRHIELFEGQGPGPWLRRVSIDSVWFPRDPSARKSRKIMRVIFSEPRTAESSGRRRTVAPRKAENFLRSSMSVLFKTYVLSALAMLVGHFLTYRSEIARRLLLQKFVNRGIAAERVGFRAIPFITDQDIVDYHAAQRLQNIRTSLEFARRRDAAAGAGFLMAGGGLFGLNLSAELFLFVVILYIMNKPLLWLSKWHHTRQQSKRQTKRSVAVRTFQGSLEGSVTPCNSRRIIVFLVDLKRFLGAAD